MRMLVIGALAATLVGCSCLLPPQASMEACTDTNGFACFDRMAANQPIELEPASFKANSATIDIESTIAAKTERPSSAHARDRGHLAVKTAKSTMIATKVEPPRFAPSETPAGAGLPDSSHGTVPSEKPGATVSPDKPAMAVSPDLPARGVDVPSKPPNTNWVVSETTSPVDYTPLITAAFRLPSDVKDAPNTLAIRCRGLRTELLVRTEGTWRASPAGEVQVAYQINDQPLIKLPWTASSDGKTASYKGETVGLLQSLPEGALLKINVLDGAGSGHEATFQLAGLDAALEKIAVACKWPPAANKMSSGKR
jgi:hypothetical protein